MKNIYLLFFTLCLLISSCSPKSEALISSTNTEGNEFVEKDIDVSITEKIAVIEEIGVSINETLAKSVLNKRFNNIKKIKDIEVKSFKKNAPYYLIAKGFKDKKEILLAIELERKGLELHSS